ncbi:MAG: hypothetical protein R2778_17235 [Saprospiraceae bacterium]
MQFRRTDGGNAMFNPFVENYILDAFTTEIGGEVYLFPVDGFMAMVGMSSGFINGNVENYPEANNAAGVPTKKSPSVFAKLAYDKQISTDLHVSVCLPLCTTTATSPVTPCMPVTVQDHIISLPWNQQCKPVALLLLKVHNSLLVDSIRICQTGFRLL